MSIMFAARADSSRRPAPRGAAEGVSPPQILRLAVLVLLAAFCVGLGASARSGHAGSQRAPDSHDLATPHASR